jgi:hypothetical protein
VYNGSVSQEEVYESSVHPLLTTFLDGYNVTGQNLSWLCSFFFSDLAELADLADTSPLNPLQRLETEKISIV